MNKFLLVISIFLTSCFLVSCSPDSKKDDKKDNSIVPTRAALTGVVSVADLGDDSQRCQIPETSRNSRLNVENAKSHTARGIVENFLRKLKNGLKTFPNQLLNLTPAEGETVSTTITAEDGVYELTCSDVENGKFPATLSVSETNYKAVVSESPIDICSIAISEDEAQLKKTLKNVNEITTVITNNPDKGETEVLGGIFGNDEDGKSNISPDSFTTIQPEDTEEDESLRALLQQASSTSKTDLCDPVPESVPLLANSGYVDALAVAIRTASDPTAAINEVRENGSSIVADKFVAIKEATNDEEVEAAKDDLKTTVIVNNLSGAVKVIGDDADINNAAKPEASQLFTSLRTVYNDTFFDQEAGASGSVQQYETTVNDAGDVLKELDMDMQVNKLFSKAIEESFHKITTDSNRNIVVPDNLVNHEVLIDSTSYALDVVYTSESLNNLNVSWTMKNSNGAELGTGVYFVQGDDPKKSGALGISAVMNGWTLSSDNFVYTLTDLDATEKIKDFTIKFSNLRLEKDKNYMELRDLIVSGHYEFDGTIDDGSLFNQSTRKTYFNEFSFSGELATEKAKVTGEFHANNFSNSVILNSFFTYSSESCHKGDLPTDYNPNTSKFLCYSPTSVQLFDVIQFKGDFEKLDSEKKIEIDILITLDPNQEIYLTSPYSSQGPNSYLEVENQPLSTFLNFGEDDKLITNFLKGKVLVSGKFDSLLNSTEYQVYAEVNRSSFDRGSIEIGFKGTDVGFVVSSSLHLKFENGGVAAEKVENLTLKGNGVRVFFNDVVDSDFDNQTTRDIGTIANKEGVQLGTVEYNSDLFFLARYLDGTFESLQ